MVVGQWKAIKAQIFSRGDSCRKALLCFGSRKCSPTVLGRPKAKSSANADIWISSQIFTNILIKQILMITWGDRDPAFTKPWQCWNAEFYFSIVTQWNIYLCWWECIHLSRLSVTEALQTHSKLLFIYFFITYLPIYKLNWKKPLIYFLWFLPAKGWPLLRMNNYKHIWGYFFKWK